uniref:Uncharacterized protein n=1 Tax=Sus scrofa TaxID=9823 RepID=A0A4X1TFM8_PIG
MNEWEEAAQGSTWRAASSEEPGSVHAGEGGGMRSRLLDTVRRAQSLGKVMGGHHLIKTM